MIDGIQTAASSLVLYLVFAIPLAIGLAVLARGYTTASAKLKMLGFVTPPLLFAVIALSLWGGAVVNSVPPEEVICGIAGALAAITIAGGTVAQIALILLTSVVFLPAEQGPRSAR